MGLMFCGTNQPSILSEGIHIGMDKLCHQKGGGQITSQIYWKGCVIFSLWWYLCSFSGTLWDFHEWILLVYFSLDPETYYIISNLAPYNLTLSSTNQWTSGNYQQGVKIYFDKDHANPLSWLGYKTSRIPLGIANHVMEFYRIHPI